MWNVILRKPFSQNLELASWKCSVPERGCLCFLSHVRYKWESQLSGCRGQFLINTWHKDLHRPAQIKNDWNWPVQKHELISPNFSCYPSKCSVMQISKTRRQSGAILPCALFVFQLDSMQKCPKPMHRFPQETHSNLVLKDLTKEKGEHQGIFTFGNARSFLCADVKNSLPLDSTLNFDADVKKRTAHKWYENLFRNPAWTWHRTRKNMFQRIK